MAPYTPLSRGVRGEDPDAVYAAALRVLERKGWGIEYTDSYLHEVRTAWFPFRDIGLSTGSTPNYSYSAAWKVKIAGGRIQVFTDCYWTIDLEPHRVERCPDDERPEGLRERELELAADILDEAHAPAAPAALRGPSATSTTTAPPRSSPTPVLMGCASDVECKGDRLCQGGECVDPPTTDTAF
jgi:hypothetical protein